MNAIHLASFNGNIGDIANHIGFWNLFGKYVDKNVNITNLEIREFYKSWNLRAFDEHFVEEVNKYDLFVIGGGNFFDVKWDYSQTGTTLNLSKEILDKIEIPIVFNGIGVDYAPDTSPEIAKTRFESFLDYLNTRRNNTIVSVRNDDSMLLLNKHFGNCSFDNVVQIPDGGFFTSAKEYNHPEIPSDKTIVAVNLAKDRLIDRWGSEERYKQYCGEFADFINKTLSNNPEIHFAFLPHIPSDIQAIFDVLSGVKDYYCRRNITIAPYLNGVNTPGDYLIDLYRKATVSIGMRYHSNICSVAMGTPTIGIVTLDKHINLYRNIGMEDRLFDVKEVPFSDRLYDRLMEVVNNRDIFFEQNKQLVSNLEHESIAYYNMIKNIC